MHSKHLFIGAIIYWESVKYHDVKRKKGPVERVEKDTLGERLWEIF